jgi:hypothetical protein
MIQKLAPKKTQKEDNTQNLRRFEYLLGFGFWKICKKSIEN